MLFTLLSQNRLIIRYIFVCFLIYLYLFCLSLNCYQNPLLYVLSVTLFFTNSYITITHPAACHLIWELFTCFLLSFCVSCYCSTQINTLWMIQTPNNWIYYTIFLRACFSCLSSLLVVDLFNNNYTYSQHTHRAVRPFPRNWWPTCCRWPVPITSSPWIYMRPKFR